MIARHKPPTSLESRRALDWPADSWQNGGSGGGDNRDARCSLSFAEPDWLAKAVLASEICKRNQLGGRPITMLLAQQWPSSWQAAGRAKMVSRMVISGRPSRAAKGWPADAQLASERALARRSRARSLARLRADNGQRTTAGRQSPTGERALVRPPDALAERTCPVKFSVVLCKALAKSE